MASTKNRIPLIVLGGVVAILAAVTIWKANRSDTTSSVMAPAATMQDGSLPADMPTAAGGPGMHHLPMRPGNVSGVGSRPPTREEMLAHRKERAEKATRVYDLAQAQFAAQPVNPAWSSRTEQGLRKLADDAVFAKVQAQPKDLQVDCKSSMCEIRSQFASDGQARDWTQVYMTNAAGTISLARVRFFQNRDGTTQVRIYAYK